MDIISGIILGAVQGLTEFLPISSTGHLILAREVLGLQVGYGLSVDAVLHLATALAVVIYFRADFWRLVCVLCRWLRELPHLLLQHTGVAGGGEARGQDQRDRTLLLALILGTVPAVVFGLLLEDIIETTFRNPLLVAGALIAGSLLFLAAEGIIKKRENARSAPTASEGLGIGFFQALALVPGMSRSGMTIVGGMLLGLTRAEAARFGFLLSLPIILGAGGRSAFELGLSGVFAELGVPLFFAALAAFATAMLAIHYLLKYLREHTLAIFVVYRLALAAIVLVVLF